MVHGTALIGSSGVFMLVAGVLGELFVLMSARCDVRYVEVQREWLLDAICSGHRSGSC